METSLNSTGSRHTINWVLNFKLTAISASSTFSSVLLCHSWASTCKLTKMDKKRQLLLKSFWLRPTSSARWVSRISWHAITTILAARWRDQLSTRPPRTRREMILGMTTKAMPLSSRAWWCNRTGFESWLVAVQSRLSIHKKKSENLLVLGVLAPRQTPC